MKNILLASLLAICTTATFAVEMQNQQQGRFSPEQRSELRGQMQDFNQDHPMSKEHFERFKQKALDRHLQHLEKVHASIACIKSATTPESLRDCRRKEHEDMKAEREQRKDMMDKMRERRDGRNDRNPNQQGGRF